jgi:hypothetical protein
MMSLPAIMTTLGRIQDGFHSAGTGLGCSTNPASASAER